MRVSRRLQRQLRPSNLARLVIAAVRRLIHAAKAFDSGLSEPLPPAVEAATLRWFFIYLGACIAIWTAVYFHNSLNIFQVHQ